MENVAQVEQKQAKAMIPYVPGKGLIPVDFDGAYRLAQILAASGLMPKGLDRPERVFVALQLGFELGITPMQAVQNIAVINNQPRVFGDLPLAMVRRSGQLESFEERAEGEGESYTATCIVKRKGDIKSVARSFSLQRAKAAGLASKDIWQKYPERMCMFRARQWALRDVFGDVLLGLPRHIADADDDAEMINVSPATQEKTAPIDNKKLEDLLGAPEVLPFQEVKEEIKTPKTEVELYAEPQEPLELNVIPDLQKLAQIVFGQNVTFIEFSTVDDYTTDSEKNKWLTIKVLKAKDILKGEIGFPTPKGFDEIRIATYPNHEHWLMVSVQVRPTPPKIKEPQPEEVPIEEFFKETSAPEPKFKERVLKYLKDSGADVLQVWNEVDLYANYVAEKTQRDRLEVEQMACKSESAFVGFMQYFESWHQKRLAQEGETARKLIEKEDEPDATPETIDDMQDKYHDAEQPPWEEDKLNPETPTQLDPTDFDAYKNKRNGMLVINYLKDHREAFEANPERLAQAKDWFDKRFAGKGYDWPLAVQNGQQQNGGNGGADINKQLAQLKAQVSQIRNEDMRGLLKASTSTWMSTNPLTVEGYNRLIEAYWEGKQSGKW
jgi:hypothetical protein